MLPDLGAALRHPIRIEKSDISPHGIAAATNANCASISFKYRYEGRDYMATVEMPCRGERDLNAVLESVLSGGLRFAPSRATAYRGISGERVVPLVPMRGEGPQLSSIAPKVLTSADSQALQKAEAKRARRAARNQLWLRSA